MKSSNLGKLNFLLEGISVNLNGINKLMNEKVESDAMIPFLNKIDIDLYNIENLIEMR